jgi:hypothetical protein
MQLIEYDMGYFKWHNRENSFYADAWTLFAVDEAHESVAEPFPSGRSQFIIRNLETDGFRRFTFERELVINEPGLNATEWVFKSEDGMFCKILINAYVNED